MGEKKTGHEIVKDLKLYHPLVVNIFKVDEKEREYRSWQRDPLAIEMIGKNNVEQKTIRRGGIYIIILCMNVGI